MISEKIMTMQQAEEEMMYFRRIFDIVRLLDEEALLKLQQERIEAEERFDKEPEMDVNAHFCKGCVAMVAFREKREVSKLEFLKDDIYHITAKYLEIDGKPYVMEIMKCLDKNCLVEESDRERLVSSLTGYNERLYCDALTQAYNRRYFEDEIKKRPGPAGYCHDRPGRL